MAKLRAQLVAAEQAEGDNEQFRKLLELRQENPGLGEYDLVTGAGDRALADGLVLRRDHRRRLELRASSATTRSSTATGSSAGSPT